MRCWFWLWSHGYLLHRSMFPLGCSFRRLQTWLDSASVRNWNRAFVWIERWFRLWCLGGLLRFSQEIVLERCFHWLLFFQHLSGLQLLCSYRRWILLLARLIRRCRLREPSTNASYSDIRLLSHCRLWCFRLSRRDRGWRSRVSLSLFLYSRCWNSLSLWRSDGGDLSISSYFDILFS